jgi:hypothetical protein
MLRRMPSPAHEAQPPQDIAKQISVGQWLVAASGGLTAALGRRSLAEDERIALDVLRDALRSAAAEESLVAISGELGLVSAREAMYLVDAAGEEAVPALTEMADALSHALEGELSSADERGVERARRMLLALSQLRLAQARHLDRSQASEPWWPTTLSSVS